MKRFKILKQTRVILIPSMTVAAGTGALITAGLLKNSVVAAQEINPETNDEQKQPETNKEPQCDPDKLLVRRSDLLMYGSPETIKVAPKLYPCPWANPCDLAVPNDRLMNAIKYSKQKLQELKKLSEEQQVKLKAYITEVYNYILRSLEDLRKEENKDIQYGLIAGGAILGLLCGIIKGGLRNILLYQAVGALSMVYLCYPQEFTEQAHDVLSFIKDALTIVITESKRLYDQIFGVTDEETDSRYDDVAYQQLKSMSLFDLIKTPPNFHDKIDDTVEKDETDNDDDRNSKTDQNS